MEYSRCKHTYRIAVPTETRKSLADAGLTPVATRQLSCASFASEGEDFCLNCRDVRTPNCCIRAPAEIEADLEYLRSIPLLSSAISP